MDTVSPQRRSEIMAKVRSKDSGPELLVRKTAFALGYRYRLHRRDLPGCPDLVFPARRKVIFVHGCFWHRHARCKLARMPKSRLEFWTAKLESNRKRDLRSQRALRLAGWQVLILWECQLGDPDRLRDRIGGFLEKR